MATDFLGALDALVAGNPEPLFRVTCDRFTAASGLHAYAHLKESDFQTLLIGAFSFTNAYTVTSEVEVRGEDRGFIDILAVPTVGSRAQSAYLVEVKYLSPKNATDQAKSDAIVEAKSQISRYEKADDLKRLPNLKRIVVLFVGLKLEMLEIY